jgi:RNA-directed DNA polymerase
VVAWTKNNGLTLYPDKIHVGNWMKRGEEFEFLGDRFQSGKRFVRTKSQTKIKDRIRGLTPRNQAKSLKEVITNLNRTLMGWFNYFNSAEKKYFSSIRWVHPTTESPAAQTNKSKGVGKSRECHERWPNSFFAKEGLFTIDA